MKYSVKDLLDKRGNNKFIPLSGVDRLKHTLTFYCSVCGTQYTGTGVQYLYKKSCDVCARKDKINKFNIRFLNSHKDNSADYIILFYTKKFVVVKHNTQWCQHIFRVDYNDYMQNCPICFKGTSFDVHVYASRNYIDDPHIHLIKYVNKNEKSKLYCDRCKNYFYKNLGLGLNARCPYCDDKLKVPVIKELISVLNKEIRSRKIIEDKCREYANSFPSDITVVYSYKRSGFFLIHKCVDDCYRIVPLARRRACSISNNSNYSYKCPYCYRIKQEHLIKKLLRAYNPDFVLATHYVSYSHPVVLFNIREGFYIQKRFDTSSFSRRFKHFKGYDYYSRLVLLQRSLNVFYGKGVYNVLSYDEDNMEAIVKHLACGRSYTYNINSMLTFDVRCKYCKRPLGEQTIIRILEDLDINYISPAIIGAKRDNYDLHYDFYLPDYNVLIEYDGAQHYGPIGALGGEDAYKKRVINDNIKTDYAKDNGYRLLRIDYNVRKYDKIKDKMLEFIHESSE